MKRVFISYSRRDAEMVDKITKVLESAGIDVWIDRSDISGGSVWRESIVNGIEQCNVFILALSPASVSSDNVRKELDIAEGFKKKILPVQLLPTSIPNIFKYQLGGLQIIDLSNNFNIGVNQIINVVTGQQATIETPNNKKPSVIKYGIGLVGLLLVFLMAGWILSISNNPPAKATETQEPTNTHMPTATEITPTTVITDTPIPIIVITATQEPGYIFENTSEVPSLAIGMKPMTDLAIEKYSTSELSQWNKTLTFTIETPIYQSLLWRWYWCATTETTLAQNLKHIEIGFEADGQALPLSKFSLMAFKSGIPSLKDWSCSGYQTILKDWKVGEYKFSQTFIIKSNISDGKDTYQAGYRTYDFIIKALP